MVRVFLLIPVLEYLVPVNDKRKRQSPASDRSNQTTRSREWDGVQVRIVTSTFLPAPDFDGHELAPLSFLPLSRMLPSHQVSRFHMHVTCVALPNGGPCVSFEQVVCTDRIRVACACGKCIERTRKGGGQNKNSISTRLIRRPVSQPE